ncbi:signal recognition particle, SRP9/SRP14 subunit [Sphaerulina musiva SO2202]|uniref:Signal recognition particle subunit SRP14 n=1 Tax=Sphaerulina musiva (strain SO2202) TaxID=692275 RepID=M3D3L9_SPHMS|nr:signal recognition particle, SRP9/SRP14 subunit [Sphaerulina musiva SO2202]EMF12499.1 signal recognition particle, SRP9/SRP14 subunit [Sphaerulina musiva SO2202]
MAKAHLGNDEFFTKLTSLIAKTQEKGHGSIFLTQKRLTYPASTPVNPSQTLDPLHDLNPPSDPLPIIIRATDGKSQSKDSKKTTAQKIKLSTIVQPDDLESFFAKYAEVCKTGMQSLKKRDRSKRKKVKGKAASASKK